MFHHRKLVKLLAPMLITWIKNDYSGDKGLIHLDLF